MTTSSVSRFQAYLGLAKDVWQLKWARSDASRGIARQHLVARMGRLRCLPQKLGQMIGFSQGNSESMEDFSKLEAAAEPLPLPAIIPLLEQEWGRPTTEVLRNIEPYAKGASLGQVHRATLHDGREVAIKVQYPGMHDAILFDLRMLGWLSVPLGNLNRGFDLAGYRDIFLDDLERELDYRQEACAQREFSCWAASSDCLAVPEVIDELSTSKVLVSCWEEGDNWAEVQNSWTADQKQLLGRRLIELFHDGLFRRGILHADLHPGNLRFRVVGKSVQLLLYDFGCIYRSTDENRFTLMRLIRASRQQNESPYPLFLKLGFREQFLGSIENKLPAVCQILFEPYTTEYPYDISDWRLGERLGDILGEDRWNFRFAGPPQMVFLLRAFHALIYYLKGLHACVSWSQIAGSYIDQFSENLQNLEVPSTCRTTTNFSGLAKLLKIRVTESGTTKVQVSQRASAIDNLEELIDQDLQARINKQGVNLKELVANVRRQCYAPSEIFRLVEGTKEIVVWLE